MIYSKFKDLSLSRLGFGCMRLPETESQKNIDEKKAFEMIDHAYRNGVNYFDTAYFYHAGESETFIGKALAQYPRDTWYLANKIPGNAMTIEDGNLKLDLGGFKMENVTFSSPAGIFEQQLERCNVDYFDFYMLHNMTEFTYDLYTDEKIGIIDYLLSQKKAGRIRHLGFSSHARPETLEKFLNSYDCFEFAQIQLNYLDWTLQEADKKYEVLTNHGMPIIAMEPMRGGKLAAPGDAETSILKAVRPDDTPASWAFRFLQSLPNVSIVLTGMSTMEQLVENIEIFSNDNHMPEPEKLTLQEVVDAMAEFVPCTACRYCCAKCPQELDIPMLISTYNEAVYDMRDVSKVTWYVKDVLEALSEEEMPQACISCGTCVPLCPQSIDIPDTLAKFSALLV